MGVSVTLIAGTASTAGIAYRYWAGQSAAAPEVAIVTAAVWLLLIVWVAVITPAWVRVPADAYGMQLLAACDTLGTPQAAKPRKNARQARKK